MKGDLFSLGQNPERLIAVPAVHYRAAFAYRVNGLCQNSDTRPEAIAVELGPGQAAAVAKWFKDLKINRSGARLPTMLGLVSQNKRIHPQFRAKANRLQKKHGCQLFELPGSVLMEELAYSPVSLLCLSATDSIIEAIRCAVEFDIPVYGVDLDQAAFVRYPALMLQDPLNAFQNYEKYVEFNQTLAKEGRDPYIDGRREVVMAARLKLLLQTHEKVLFTGGIGHWSDLKSLLKDPNFKAASHLPRGDYAGFMRVLVHPSLAVDQMDIIPSMTNWYENLRGRIKRNDKIKPTNEMRRLFIAQMQTVYSNYFSKEESGYQHGDNGNAQERLISFEQFLARLCLLKQQNLPHFGLMIKAARAIMPPRFVKILAETVMKHDMTWAMPSDFKGLPLLTPPRASDDSGLCTTSQMARLKFSKRNSGQEDEVLSQSSEPFYFTSIHREGHPGTRILVPWDSEKQQEEKEQKGFFGSQWIWPPCEYFLHGTAFEAAKLIDSMARERASEEFTGSLLDGVDVKSTLRAKTRKENKFYVHQNKKSLQADTTIANGRSLEPTVFIFEDPYQVCAGHWDVALVGGSNLKNFIDPSYHDRFDDLIKRFGSNFVGSVAVARSARIPKPLNTVISGANEMAGILTFGNPCAHINQSALWLQATRFQSCPILFRRGINELIKFYEQHHKFLVNLGNWSSTLVNLAIPYAKNRVVIVAHEKFQIDPAVIQLARKYQVSLNQLPLNHYSSEEIRQLRTRYTVYGGETGASFEPAVEKFLGPKDKYLDMLPEPIQAQVTENR